MIHAFDDYELDTHLYELRRAGQRLQLEPKAFDVLVYLIQHHERVVPKEELLERLWPEQFISPAALNSSIMTARKALGDDGRTQGVIQTLRGRGYRFVAALAEPRSDTCAQETPAVPGSFPPPQRDPAPGVGTSPADPPTAGRGALESEGALASEAESRPCLLCQHSNGVEATFCAACGTRLVHVCAGCASRVFLPAVFCSTCGQRLEAAAVALRGERPYSPFIGRERELALLHERLVRVQAGVGQVVELLGAPGIGKSRLLDEFRRRLTGTALTYVTGHCYASGPVRPYGPVLDAIRQSCDITEADSPETVTAKVYHYLREIRLVSADAAPCLLWLLGVEEQAERLLGLSPESLKMRLLLTLCQLFVVASRRQPVVLVIEELHWIDPTSATWLAALVESVPHVPLLVLLTCPPEARPAWLVEVTTQMPLAPLTSEESSSVVHTILPPDAWPPPLIHRVVTQAQGNPLLLEELAQLHAESGGQDVDIAQVSRIGFKALLTYAESGGQDVDIAPLATLQEVLRRRLERLSPMSQQLVLSAAVLGPTFSLRLLRRVWEEQSDVERALLELERRGWCYEQREAPEPVFAFKHAQLREAAYTSLLPSRRQALHAAAAQALEALYAEHPEHIAALLAYHYAASEQTAKAVESLTHVATQVAQQGALPEALATLQATLAHVERLPPAERAARRLELVLHHAEALFNLGRWQETAALLVQQQPRVAQQGDTRLEGRYALLLSQTQSQLGAWDQAVQQGCRAVEKARACHDDVTLGQAYQVLAMARYWEGEVREGLDCSQFAITLLERPQERTRLGLAHCVLALNALVLGDFASALEATAEAHTIGQELGDPHLQTFAAWATGWIQATRGEWEAGLTACQRGVEWAPDPLSAAFALGWLGYAYLEQGDAEQAISPLQQAIQGMRQFAYGRLQGLYTIFLGETHLAQGDAEAAYTVVCRGLEMVTSTRYRFGMGWAQRALGRIAQSRGTLAVAQVALTEALQTFDALGARFEVGRTQLALADLASAANDHDVAATHVAEAHKVFTDLRVPVYVQRVKQQAQALGLPFASA